MCPYSKHVQDIEQFGASVGDDLDAKLNQFKHIKLVIINFWKFEQYGASVGEQFDAKKN